MGAGERLSSLNSAAESITKYYFIYHGTLTVIIILAVLAAVVRIKKNKSGETDGEKEKNIFPHG